MLQASDEHVCCHQPSASEHSHGTGYAAGKVCKRPPLPAPALQPLLGAKPCLWFGAFRAEFFSPLWKEPPVSQGSSPAAPLERLFPAGREENPHVSPAALAQIVALSHPKVFLQKEFVALNTLRFGNFTNSTLNTAKTCSSFPVLRSFSLQKLLLNCCSSAWRGDTCYAICYGLSNLCRLPH